MMTLTDFLLARIANDEATAKAAQPSGRGDGEMHTSWVCDEFWHVALGEDRMLAECEAKRRIIEDCSDLLGDNCCRTHQIEGARILRNLALPYASHPDYREEWKP